MKARRLRDRVLMQKNLNFLLTNRVPRILVTRLMGWYSRIESPLLCSASIAVWRLFTELDLADAPRRRYSSLNAFFTRELKPGARPVNPEPEILASPCDGIVGACGRVEGTRVFQAKGFPYELAELLGSAELADGYRDGCYVTLRLTSGMYHRFHAPHDCTLRQVTYISGDTWNVNPIALKKIERLSCRNERAVLECRLENCARDLLLVPVAAILVASIRLHFLDTRLHLRYRGPNRIACQAHHRKGQEMGWFEHGPTILVFAPAGFALCEGVREGHPIRMGEALMSLPMADRKAIGSGVPSRD